MPSLDSSAAAAVNGHFAPAWIAYLDLLGDPLRVTTYGADTVFASTGDADLDGNTFASFGGELVEVGDVSNSDNGSDTLTVTLSGILGVDTELLAEIGDRTKWQGRTARLWFQIYDESGLTPQGAVVSYYTGYMSSVRFIADTGSQTLELSIENYLAFTTQASNRSYLNQSYYDPADTSAAATMAASNGLRSSSGNGGAVSGNLTGAGAGGGLRPGNFKVNN